MRSLIHGASKSRFDKTIKLRRSSDGGNTLQRTHQSSSNVQKSTRRAEDLVGRNIFIMKNKIAIISSQAFSLTNFRGSLIRELSSAGVTVIALAPDFDTKSRLAVRALGAEPVDYRLSRTGMNPLSDITDLIDLTLVLRRERPDISLAYFIKPVIYGSIAAWLSGIPKRYAMIEGLGYVFSEEHGGQESLKRRALRLIVTQLYRLALSRVSRVFFLNEDDVREFASRRIISGEKSYNLGGIGVDLGEWQKVKVNSEPITFLLAARLLREKGIVEYVNAARRVKAHHPTTRFILLGGLDPNPGGLSSDEVESWVSEGVIEWPGHVAVKPWLAEASVYVLPSYYREGVPRSTQEAMAMGRPVITTDAPGCRDTVIEGKNGFLVPKRDVDALVVAMERFIDNPEMIEVMGQSSRRLAEERFDAHKINRKLMELMGVARLENCTIELKQPRGR